MMMNENLMQNYDDIPNDTKHRAMELVCSNLKERWKKTGDRNAFLLLSAVKKLML
jgi:hypothetical protein|tara:strand:+ start:4692 stop:4856 length:165 start_codon:yes stop_codon:yes gene_type:complete